MDSKFNTYMINISISLQNYSVNNTSDDIQYDFYAIILADSKESAYEACERERSTGFYKYVPKYHFYESIDIIDDKTKYPGTPEMNSMWSSSNSTVLYHRYNSKYMLSNRSFSSGYGIRDHIKNYNIDESLYKF